MSKENDQNINVFVRIKPIDKTNISEKCATTAVKMISDKEIMVRERSHDRFSKNFTFDRVFDTMSTQIDVYKTVMSPLLKEVIAGYNCTVFAYGQTNTGKTYTMEGDHLSDLNLHWQSDTSTGMIPRCLSHLFDELLSRENYVVKINHLELYNEELFDLLSNDNDTSTSKLVLYEDARKGALTIQGLQEVIVHNKYEAYEILKRNSERRQTATTLLNISSSRSHTVFSIIVQMREKRDGNELLKTAKLNLVDLAGTENINKSGAVDERARETKNINKSLLALGRVITALVNKTAHIPYRESKLTRLLQESLGGQTKTSIIATVSSVSSNIEETLSTLEYAHRARNITNHPKINQTLCNRRLLMECTREIECLRRDLLATRTKNGIFLPQSDYDDMQMAIMHQGKKIQELNNVHKMLQDEEKSLEERICNLRLQYNTQADILTETIRELYDVKNSLKLKNKYVKQAEDDKNKQKYLVEKHVATIQILYAETRSLLNVINEISEHAQKLHDKLYCEKQIEEKNEKLARQTKSDLVKRYMDMENLLLTYKRNNNIIFQITRDEIETQIVKKIKDMEAKVCSVINYLVQQHFVKSENSKDSINASYTCYQKMLNSYMQDTSCTTKKKIQCFTNLNLDVISIIFDLLKYNEVFVQNLQILKTNVLLKLENMSNYAFFAFKAICSARFKECFHFLESLNKIREHINCIVQNKKQSKENCEQLGKEMENLLCKFSITNKEKNYFEIIDVSQQIDKLCAVMYDCTQIYDADISQIKSDIDHHFSQMCMMSKIVIEKGNILVDDFQKRLNSTCTILERYNDNVRSNNLEQIEKKMAEEKVKKLNSINNICLTQRVKNLSSDYAPFVKQISDSCKKINNQLTIHNAETHNCTNNIIEKIQASQRQIDKFLTKDFDRYVPTGSTPPRKKFSYPRKFAEFATTSPSLSQSTLNKPLTDF